MGWIASLTTSSESTMQKKFLEKVLLNLISNWSDTYYYDSFLHRVLNNSYYFFQGDSVRSEASEWDSELQHLREKGKTERHEKYGLSVTIKDVMSAEDIRAARQKIENENPEITMDFRVESNTKLLGELLELTNAEMLILQMALYCNTGVLHPYNDMLSSFSHASEFEDPAYAYRVMLGISEDEANAALKGFLFTSGMLTKNTRIRYLHQLVPELAEAFVDTSMTRDSLSSSLFPTSIKTSLKPTDYPHFTKEIARTQSIISRALEQRTQGMNVMFWGLPGCGKTELALALAEQNNWDLKVIGDSSQADNNEKSRAQRLASLKIAMKLYANAKDVVLLFDEMEDLFKSDSTASFSKAFINRIIESTPVPIIWTTNSLAVMGSAVLRRMTYNIGFEVPPADARRTIWAGAAEKHGVVVEDRVLDDLAHNFDITPALINNAVKITKLAGLEHSEIKEIVQSLDRLVSLGEKRKFTTMGTKNTPYDPQWANTDLDLGRLTTQLKAAEPNFSICAYGPPGTGKSEYGRYLAEQLGKRVLYKRASDLLSMWVGGTEKNIAMAFEQSREEEKALIIDEGDTFLQNREKAQRSWEVSQVNEMLSQMENHTQPFILTTNLMDDLDPAAMRRFTFKMKFNFMREDQAVEMFRAYYKSEPPAAIRSNDLLAPGDFANVLRKTTILKITDPGEIYAMLQGECDLKPQGRNRLRVGF